jgi:outer membrane receptor protein involved in Fe transport
VLGRRVVVGGVADVVRGRGPGGSALPFMPAARLGGSLRYDARAWAVGADVRHAFAQRDVAADNAVAVRNPLDIATGAYTLVNLQASWTLPGRRTAHVLTLRVDNLLDVRYVDATSRIKAFGWNPGRNIAAGWRISY